MPDGLDFDALPRWCVFTDAGVVRHALDAIGWTDSSDLSGCRLLEPAAGDGAFVTEAARRLIRSMRARAQPISWESLRDRILALEIEEVIAAKLRSAVQTTLVNSGLLNPLAIRLARHWCAAEDFLAIKLGADFTHAVGNPPFRRSGGSGPDACVPFIHRSFDLLRPGGCTAMLAPVALGSATGAASMRQMISSRGCVEAVESFEPSRAFARRVGVRGALFIIRRHDVEREAAAPCSIPWLAGSAEARAAFLFAREHMPTLEDAGCRVRLGVATGKNSIFVRLSEEFAIEEDLLIRVVATRDLGPKSVAWRGMCMPDTSRPDGRPWTQKEKPRLYAYLKRNHEELRDRHSVAAGASWRLTHTRIELARV